METFKTTFTQIKITEDEMHKLITDFVKKNGAALTASAEIRLNSVMINSGGLHEICIITMKDGGK